MYLVSIPVFGTGIFWNFLLVERIKVYFVRLMNDFWKAIHEIGAGCQEN